MITMLKAIDNLNYEKQLFYGLFTLSNCEITIHKHDFYEILFVVEGQIEHNVNSVKQTLFTGNLVFVRPNDAHMLKNTYSQYSRYYNFAFSENILQDLVLCFNMEFILNEIEKSKLSPIATLSNAEIESIKQKCENLNNITNKDIKITKIYLKQIISEMISKFIVLNHTNSQNKTPLWFEKLCLKLQNMSNFENGMAIMSEISGKSSQQIWRAFKKYLNICPGQYLNDLRLIYAANQLTNSDTSIIYICMDTGFNSLSHFYKVFKKRYGISPRAYRKANASKLFNLC